MSEIRTFTLLKQLFIILVLLLSAYGVYACLSTDYRSFLGKVLLEIPNTDMYEKLVRNEYIPLHFKGSHFAQYYPRLAANSSLEGVYTLVNFFLLYLFIALVAWLYGFYRGSNGLLDRGMDKLLRRVVAWLYGNKAYIRDLPSAVRKAFILMLIVQGFFLLYLVCTLPFDYDEAMSYVNFSSRGIIHTAIFYPDPNNHQLLNILARLFNYLPLRSSITVRLPCFFAHFVAVYYLFKLSRRHFSDNVSLLVTALYSASYGVVLYAVEGRGYGLLNACTVLLLYAADHFTERPEARRHRWLYSCCLASGVYAVPSFIYGAFGIVMAVGSWYLLHRRWKGLIRFIVDTGKAGIALALLFGIVVCFNGISGLSNPNGSVRQSAHDIAAQLIPHLSNTWMMITGGYDIPLSIVVPLVIA
ncbi:MAG TPA: glycosyltransferase family 39 protein, partial [Puia sp.]|nr:glycosyltransferase family 39 protein [Puia sp.]